MLLYFPEEILNKPSTSKAASSDGNEQYPSVTVPEQVHEKKWHSKIYPSISENEQEREITGNQVHHEQFTSEGESEKGPTDKTEPTSEPVQKRQHSIKQRVRFESDGENVDHHDKDNIPSTSTSGQEINRGENEEPVSSSKVGQDGYEVNQMQRGML